MSKPIKDWFAKTFDDWVDEGYPEEIIPDILSGDLPMDEASKAARAAEQGYGSVLYHGSTNPNLTEIAPMEVGKRNATGGNGLFLTDNPRVASTYAYDARVNGGTGPDGGTVYPLRVRDVHPNERVTVADRGVRGDQYKTWWDDILPEKIRGMDIDGFDDATGLSTDQVNRNANKQGKKVVEYSRLMDSAEDVYEIGGTDVPSNVTAVLDNTLVRSPNAAFHPTYKGPNIKGNADPRLLGGMAVGLTTAGLVAPEIAQRFPMPEGGNRAGWLEYVTNLGDQTQNSLRHATGGVSDYFFPEAVNDYLKKVNAEDEEPTWSDRLWAGLDAFRIPGK